MKSVVIIFLLLAQTACHTSDVKEQNSPQSRFDQYVDLEGPISVKELQSEYPIFMVNRQYQPDPMVVNELNSIKVPIVIKAFMGTWCHDSQREIPNLVTLMESLDNDTIELQLIALDRQKKDSAGEARKANVQYTPTIIVYEGKKSGNVRELGRIVEKTTQAMEQEILDIINGK